jgi:glycerophosphoryl diester phosphodiesterase
MRALIPPATMAEDPCRTCEDDDDQRGHSLRMRDRDAAVAMAVLVLGSCCAALGTAGDARPPLERDHEASRPLAPGQPGGRPRELDVQAHRGGLGLVTESTLDAFANALRIGVTTLELDVRLTADGEPVVTHDRRVPATKCRDTAPSVAGDREYPYVGDLIRRLSVAQLATLDCGWQQLPGFPHQRVVANARMPLLSEVFTLVDCYGADEVRFSIDVKFPADAPGESASRGRLVRVVAREIRQARLLDRVAIASVDWGVLMRMRKVEARLPIVAASHPRFLQAGKAAASPWLGGIDIDDFHGSVVAAAASFGANAISPVHGTPTGAGTGDKGYTAFTTRKLVRRAHRNGLKVVPWTVDDAPTMRRLIEADVDGIITDYPNRLRAVMARRGLRLPAPMSAPLSDRRCLP